MCRVKAILERYDNGDAEQLRVIADDRTRNVEMIARSLRVFDPELIGSDIRKHQHGTCDCNGWID